MVVLGIDPGLERLGWAVTTEERGTPRAIGYGCFTTARGEAVEERLRLIHAEVRRLTALHAPTVLSIEKLLFQKNVKTAIVVAQARGVALAAAAEAGLLVVEQTPNAVKLAVTGYGAADKRQVQLMVKTLFGLSEIPRPDDAADALAIAYAGYAAAALARRAGGTLGT